MDVLTYALCKEYTNEAIAGISGGLTPIIVEQLPQSGESDKLYFVTSQSGSGQNIYEEYIWIDNKFEKLGSNEVPGTDSDFYKLMLTESQVEVVAQVLQSVYPQELTLTLTEEQLADIQENAMGKNIQMVASIDGVEAPIFTFNVFGGTMYICTIVNTPGEYGQYWFGEFSLDSISGGNLTISFFPVISNINLINGIFDFGNITDGTTIPVEMQSAFSVINAPGLLKANGIVYKYLNYKVTGGGSTLTYYYQTFDFEQAGGVVGDILASKIMYFNNTDYAVHFIDKVLNPEVKYVTFDNVTVGTNRRATLTVTENTWIQLATFTNNPLYICKVQLNITGGNIIVLDFVKKETNTLYFGGTIGNTQYYAKFVNNNGTYSGTFGDDVYVHNGQLRENGGYPGLYNSLYNLGNPINMLQVTDGVFAMGYYGNGPLSLSSTNYITISNAKSFSLANVDHDGNLIYKEVLYPLFHDRWANTNDDSSFRIGYLNTHEVEIKIKNNDTISVSYYPTLEAVNLTGALERRQLKDIVVSFTNVALSGNTTQLTITSSEWTQLTDTSSRNVKVSIGLSSGETIVLDRISSETNKVCFGCNIGSNEYYATFTNNSGTYSGVFGENIITFTNVTFDQDGTATLTVTSDEFNVLKGENNVVVALELTSGDVVALYRTKHDSDSVSFGSVYGTTEGTDKKGHLYFANFSISGSTVTGKAYEIEMGAGLTATVDDTNKTINIVLR